MEKLIDFNCVSRESTTSGIGTWDWNLNGDKATYHALFPRSWTVYNGSLHHPIKKYVWISIVNRL